jgi:hypothetical protein
VQPASGPRWGCAGSAGGRDQGGGWACGSGGSASRYSSGGERKTQLLRARRTLDWMTARSSALLDLTTGDAEGDVGGDETPALLNARFMTPPGLSRCAGPLL